MSKCYVFSTLTCDNSYVNWAAGGGDIPVQVSSILINGGAGVANDRLVTPIGVCTEVSREDLEILRKNPCFIDHEKAGFIVVEDKKQDPEKVASNMQRNDGSSPLTPDDYVNNSDLPKPSVKSVKN